MPNDTTSLAQQLPPSPKIKSAIDFATQAHHGQTRKGSTEPFINHPLRVAILITQAGLGEDVIIAALLHDTIEDTAVTSQDLDQHFGPWITSIVEQLSEDKSIPDKYQRKQSGINKLKGAPIEVLAIKCADTIDNIGSTLIKYGQQSLQSIWEPFNYSPEEKIAKWEQVYQIIFSQAPTCPLLDQYAAALSTIKQKPLP